MIEKLTATRNSSQNEGQNRFRGDLGEALNRPSVDKPTEVGLTDSENAAFLAQMSEDFDTFPQFDNRAEISATDFEPRSVLADMLRNGAERIAGFLDNRAATKDERREARAEKIERGTEVVKKIGGKTLRAAKVMGLVTLGISAISMETSVTAGEKAGTYIRQKVTQIAVFARERFRERSLRKEKQRRAVADQNTALDSYSENIAFTEAREAQDEAFATYEPNVDYHKAHEEALEVNTQKKSDQAEAYDSYADNIDFSQKKAEQDAAYESYEDNIDYHEAHEEALEEDAKFEQARRDAALRKEIALRAKALRKARRKETRTAIREKGGELLKKGAKGIGRIALKAFKGTRKIIGKAGKAAAAGAKAAVGAAKEAWQQ